MTDPLYVSIPKNATYRQEYTKCGRPGCTKLHGPYWYAYWKEGKRTKKRYIGKSRDAFEERFALAMKGIPFEKTWREMNKLMFIGPFKRMGDPVALKYSTMAIEGRCSINWAYRKVREHFLKEVVPDMYHRGMDPTDEVQIKSYLTQVLGNSKPLSNPEPIPNSNS